MKKSKHPSSSSLPKQRGVSILPKLHTEEDAAADKEGGDSRSGTTATNISIVAGPVANGETLTVMTGAEEGRVFPIQQDEVWIGRGDNCAIVLTERGVSRRHACIIRRDSGIYLRDNGAKNGTFVNNRRVDEHELRAGDEIHLGPTLCLVFSDARWGRSIEANQSVQRDARDRLVADRLQRERVESIASMVAGVAHEINTPLGVANTANAVIAALAQEVRRDPNSGKIDELLVDMTASTCLVSKNLERVSQLVQTFKQLSAHEFYDERIGCDLRAIVDECVAGLDSEMSQRGIKVRTTFTPEAEAFPWLGFQKSMCQVLIQLFHNVLRHAYDEGEEGLVDVRLVAGRAARAGDGYRLEFQDYGAGLPDEVLSRMFEPFAMSRRQKGGMGLGLAIVRNVVTHLLGGTIRCTSERGKGTHFIILLPRAAPIDKTEP